MATLVKFAVIHFSAKNRHHLYFGIGQKLKVASIFVETYFPKKFLNGWFLKAKEVG
jgi:hypothetical protein